MKKFLALAALVLGMVSCQTEPEGFDVNVGGEQDVNITVSLPEGTRADSALGAFGNVDFTKYDVRFQCEVHYGGQVKVLPVQYGRGNDAVATATFPVRLIANRDYRFVVWADLVAEGETADLRYNTSAGLHNITINDWAPMDETRDAYTCSEELEFKRNANIRLELKRPFAKLRVVTTDMNELMGVEPEEAEVVYTTEYRNSFNAVAGKAGDVYATKTHNRFEIAEYETGDEAVTTKTLFADYLFVGENDIVNFFMKVYDQNGELIDEQKNFNTPIPVKRNYVTTIKGNILTYADDFTVEIKPGFENADDLEEVPYYQEVISSAAELFRAFERGGEYILNEDLVINAVPATISTLAANSAATETVVDLNHHTITVTNKTSEAFYTVAEEESIRFEGEGTIALTEESTAQFIANEGTVEVTSGEVINNEVLGVDVFSEYVNYVDELRKAFETGGEYDMVYDVVYPETLVLEAGKSLVLNLNGKTISQSKECTSNYNMVYNKGELTINGDGAISFKDTGAGDPNFGWGSYTIRNEGKLVVNGGTIEHLGEQEAHMRCAIFQYSGSSVINGGVISTPTYRSARLWGGDMTINGGNFEGQLWLQAMNNTSSDLTINGGTFAPRGGDGSSVYITNNQGDVTFAVTGGHFTTKIGMHQPFGCITGGTFTTAAKEATSEELLAEGYEFAELENGNWTVAYVISDIEDFIKFANEVDGGNTFEGKIVKLGANINLYAEDENGEPICVDPIGSYRFDKAFMGTFDGQGHTISGLNQNTWALDNGYYYHDCGLGLFGALVDAKIQNLTIDDAHISGESAICGIIAACAQNTTFENITVKNSECADYQYYSGGIAGWVSGKNNNFINCNIDASTTVASQWGDFDNSIGGVIGGVGGSAKVFMKDCTVACRIDAVNDVVSAYRWYAYRRSGMLIGNTSKTETIDGRTVAIAPQLTCENVKVIYGDWANYTYCEFAGTGYPYVRVQAGVSVGAYVNVRYGHPTDAAGNEVVDDNHVHNEGEDHHLLLTFDQLYGGGQGVYGNPVHEGVTVVYNNK